MKTATADLISLLANGNEFVMWDVYTVTLVDSTGLVWVDGDMAQGSLFTETFEHALTGYGLVSGNASVFSTVPTIYGQSLAIAAQTNGTAAVIARALPASTIQFLSCKFMLTALNNDDAGYLSIYSAGVAQLDMNPRREVTYDSAQRAFVTLQGDVQPVTPANLPASVWYQMALSIVPGAGNTTCVVSEVASGNVVQTTTFNVNHLPVSADGLRFTADSGSLLTSAIQYDDLVIKYQIADGTNAPIIKRGAIKSTIGVQVDTLDLRLLTNSDVQVQGVPLAQFARSGGLDGARVQLDRQFAASWQSTACGSLNLFTGRVSDLTVTGAEVKMSVNSDLELLNIQMPRNIYMAQCAHTLYDTGCGLSKAAFTVTGNTTANSTVTAINCNLAQAAGYFGLGTLQFTSGLNAGITRTVKLHTTGVLVPSFPLPYVPAVGDLFSAKPGCDKLLATCNSAKFNNLANFRGFPFIPTPEATY